MNTVLFNPDGDKYVSDDGMVMAREQGKTPNGNEINDRWVLRDTNGNWIDFDKYRNDLAERNNLSICYGS